MSTSWLSGDTAVIEERASAPALITGKGQLWFNTSTHYLHYVDGTGADYLVATDIIDAAPADATYIVKTSNGTLTNEFALSSLGTGLLKVTTGTGDLTSITTSAGISALLSDETGSGVLVFNDTPTILTPTIASFVNANHTHLNAAGGGTLDTAAIATGQLALARGGTNADLSATGGTGQFLRQSSAGAAVTVAVIASADITTALTTPGPIGGTTPNTGKFTSVTVSGTAGAGYVELLNQSSAPSTPSSAGRLFFDNSNRFSWIGTNTYTRTFDGTANSANRIYVLPDQAGTILLATYTGAVASTGTHTITGSADAVQLTILANGTNTSDLVQLQSSIGAVQTRISSDGRLALYGLNFSDANTVLQANAAITIAGSASAWTIHKLTPVLTMTTANQTNNVVGIGIGITYNQGGFNQTQTGSPGVLGQNTSTTINGSSGTVSFAAGAQFATAVSGGGTVTVAADWVSRVVTNSASTLTKAVGGWIFEQSGGTNNVNLLLGGTTTGNVPSSNWSIYSLSTNNSLITGSLSLKNSTTSPTAYLHLGAGTSSASTAPIKFTTGTSMASAEAGAMEYTTDDLFFTISTSTARKRLLMADPVGGLTSNRVPYVTTNGRLTDSANFTFDGTTVTVATLAKPTTFNGDTLAGNALATNVGRIHLTGQTAAISITSIFTPPADGEYVISLVLTDTTAGVSGTISATITWTDYNGVQTFATSALTVATTGEVDFTKTIHARTTGAIRYQVDLSSIIGSPQFAIDINVIRLS